MTQLAPLIAPAIWALDKEDFDIIAFTAPLEGWQQVTLRRHHPGWGPGSSILIITVMPSGVTQVLDPYQTTCGLYTCFAAALQYLKNEVPLASFGLTIDFPQSP